MNTFLLETIITFSLNRPLLSIGLEPFFLVKDLLDKQAFKGKDYSVAIQPTDTLCTIRHSINPGEQILIAFLNDRIVLKLAYVDIPSPSRTFELALETQKQYVIGLSDFLSLKWGVKGLAVFGNFMLLDRDRNAAQLISHRIFKDKYLSIDPRGIEIKYNFQTDDCENFIRIFKAKFEGFAAGKLNPENIAVQRELFFKFTPTQYNVDHLTKILNSAKTYFSEESIKRLVNIGD